MADFDEACKEGFMYDPTSEAFLKSQLNNKKGAIIDFNKAIEKLPKHGEAKPVCTDNSSDRNKKPGS